MRDVDTETYSDACDSFYYANHAVVDSVTTLATALGGCGAMAGTDSGGRDWAKSYDEVAGKMVQAGADLGGALGSMGNLLNGALINHDAADYGARMSGPPITGASQDDGDSDPNHWMESVYPATPPSASGGNGSTPSGWHWLADHLQGFLWPDADTAKMRSAGEAWLSANRVVDVYSSSIDTAATLLGTQKSPEIPDAVAACNEVKGHMTDLAAAYKSVGDACNGYAEQVDKHHEEIVDIVEEFVAWTVVDQVTGAVLSFFTGGGAEVVAQLAESGILARYAERIVSVLRRLVTLAKAAAETIKGVLGTIVKIAEKLKKFLSVKVIRALEKVAPKLMAERNLAKLPSKVRETVDDAIARAKAGKVRFQGHDGKPYLNSDGSLPPGNYTEWTAAASGAKRGADRVIIEGNPSNPSAIYYWDHVNPPVRIGP